MFVWLKHETGLISSTTVFEKDKKTKGKEEKLKDAWRKVGTFDHRGLVAEERGTGNYKSSFKSHGVVLQRQKAYLKIVENY